MYDLADKIVFVFGIGATGKAVIDAVRKRGGMVSVYDDSENRTVDLPPDVRVLSWNDAKRCDFDLCVISPGIKPSHDLYGTVVNADKPVISEVELAWALSPCPIAAITGTNGKSTTTALAGRMLQLSGIETLIGGNISAEGWDLPLIAAVDQASSSSIIVAEISSFQLERCFHFRPACGALLNVSEDHLDRYGNSISTYADAKMRMFQAQQAEDYAVLGADCKLVMERSESVKSRKLLFSTQTIPERGAYLQNDQLWLRPEADPVLICNRSELALWAEYDVANVLAAACIAWSMGASLDGIRQAAMTFTGLPHRMNRVAVLNGVNWFNNSMCTNPEAGVAAITGVSEKYGLVLIAGGVDKGCDYTEWGKVAASKAKTIILIGRHSVMLSEAALSAGAQDVRVVDSLADAVKEAALTAREGDAVVLAPAMASFDQFLDFKDRGNQFTTLVHELRMEAKS